jgi:adenylate kinase family enzyme
MPSPSRTADNNPVNRVAVVGTSGSGKTTFAGALAARLGCHHVELDALHWDPNWTMAELDVFRQRVADATAGQAWVADGSYSKVRDVVWGRADTLVWLDYPLALVLSRLFRRTARRLVTREELWGGNRERLRDHLGRESLFLWAVQQHRRNKQRYPEALADPAYAHLRLVRHRSPREAARWLAAVDPR